jgi:hypothetical protein
MAFAFIVIGAIVVCVPIAAAVLVGMARRGEHFGTLAGPPPGPMQAMARRIMGFGAVVHEWPQPRGTRRHRRVPRSSWQSVLPQGPDYEAIEEELGSITVGDSAETRRDSLT